MVLSLFLKVLFPFFLHEGLVFIKWPSQERTIVCLYDDYLNSEHVTFSAHSFFILFKLSVFCKLPFTPVLLTRVYAPDF